jgi:hypothetical protein
MGLISRYRLWCCPIVATCFTLVSILLKDPLIDEFVFADCASLQERDMGLFAGTQMFAQLRRNVSDKTSAGMGLSPCLIFENRTGILC